MRKFAEFVMLIAGSTIVALVVCLFVAGVGSSGVNLLELTHAFFWACFAVGVIGAVISTALLRFSGRYVLLAGATTAALLGGLLYGTNAYLTKKKAEIDASNRPPNPISTPTPGLPSLVPIKKTLRPRPPVPEAKIDLHGKGAGAVVGSITTGPCSTVQIGGSDNQSQINCVPQARRLTDEEKTRLGSLTNTPLDLIVWAHGEDKNAWNLGQDICLALRNAGWRIQHPECVDAMIGPPLGGNVDMAVFLNPSDMDLVDATHTRVHLPGVSQLVNILRSFGLSVGLSPSEKVPPKFVKIVMG